ncbi:MAG: hypothetical protein GY832_44010 [Chloroflexi bacterium]|nr:hypothetical protein [Chloroflexota bacterium]
MMTVDSLWHDFLRIRDEQAEDLFTKLDCAQPGITTMNILRNEVDTVNAWMIKLTLESQSRQKITSAEREQIQKAYCADGNGNKETFAKRFDSYEALDKEIMSFTRAHELEFDEQAQVFLQHCRTDGLVITDQLHSGFEQCMQHVAIFIKYWLIAYISYGSHQEQHSS